MEKIKVDVQFRKFKDGDVIAVFPYIIDWRDCPSCYMHIGQHSGCSWDINNWTKAAKVEEYQSLKNELEGIGYILNILKRRNHKKYLKAYYDSFVNLKH